MSKFQIRVVSPVDGHVIKKFLCDAWELTAMMEAIRREAFGAAVEIWFEGLKLCRIRNIGRWMS